MSKEMKMSLKYYFWKGVASVNMALRRNRPAVRAMAKMCEACSQRYVCQNPIKIVKDEKDDFEFLGPEVR